MKKSILFLLLSFIFLGNKKTNCQTVYTDSIVGYTMNIPEGWIYETYDKGETVIMCSDTLNNAHYNVSIKKLEPGKTAKDHLEFLEGHLATAGYSSNFMPTGNRSITGENAAWYNADDVYGGAYSKIKDGHEIIQMIFVYRKGQYAYLTIQTCLKDILTQMNPVFSVFHNSFKLIH